MNRPFAVILAAALVLTPLAAAPSFAQPTRQPSPPAKAPAAPAASVVIACPYFLPAAVTPPKGFSRIDPFPGEIQGDQMWIDGGKVNCTYGSVMIQAPNRNCRRASGMWDQNGVTCTQPGRDVQSTECYARCDP